MKFNHAFSLALGSVLFMSTSVLGADEKDCVVCHQQKVEQHVAIEKTAAAIADVVKGDTCTPLSQVIHFDASGVYSNGLSIAAGTIPGKGRIGKIVLSKAGGKIDADGYVGLNNIGSQVDLTVKRDDSQNLSVKGSLIVGALEQAQVKDKVSGGEVILPEGTEACVSDVSFHLNKAPNTNLLFSGKVFLFLNHTRSYVEVWF